MRWPPFPDLTLYALRSLAAALSGTLLFTALATQYPLWWLIFVALVPLEWAIRRVRPLEALAYGFVTFFIFLTVNLWWLASFGWGAAMGLTFMEAMAYAIAVGAYSWIRRRLGGDPAHLLLPACLIIVEWKRNIGLWAFPWPMMGHALVYNQVLLQSAAIIGVLGLSFVVVWINAAISSLFLDEVRPPQARWALVRPVLAVLIAMGLYGNYSLIAAPHIDRQVAGVPATVTQRAVPTDEVWTERFRQLAFDEYTKLTAEQLESVGRIKSGNTPATTLPKENPVGIIVWPENALPGAWRFGEDLQKLADRSNSVLIYGSILAAPAGGPEPGSPGAPEPTPELAQELANSMQPLDLYNSIEVRVPGEKHPIGITSKYHLVPFGETVPMRRYLSFVDVPWGDQNLEAGKELHPIVTPAGDVGILVCYESFFAPIVRKLVKEGAEILVLSSNTSWFGEYVDATYQHAYYDRGRAVENRIPFVRAATTGVSSIIDPWGRESAITVPFEGLLLPEEGQLDPEGNVIPMDKDGNLIPQGASRTAVIHPRHGFSVYTILGDWVVVASILGLLGALLATWYPGWRRFLKDDYGVRREGTHPGSPSPQPVEPHPAWVQSTPDVR